MKTMTLAQVRRIGDGNTGIEVSEAALCATIRAGRARNESTRRAWDVEVDRLRTLVAATDEQVHLLSSIVNAESDDTARFDAAVVEANRILEEGGFLLRTRSARASLGHVIA